MQAVKIPYVNLAAQHAPLKRELLDAVSKVIDHGQFVLGPEVGEFEKRFAGYCGVDYAVSVNSGTSALFLALSSLGIGAGDEVITAPNSFLASASAIALTGARPVFVDVADDYNLDPELLEPAITPRTRAIMPVHLTGRPAKMDRIVEIAARHGVAVVEDCAQSAGARYRDRSVGSFGVAGCFSLHPLKNLNAIGDGGVITTNDAELDARLRKARNHGLRNRDECEFWSHNARLDTIQAAMLLVKMAHLDDWISQRRTHAAFYQEHLADVVQVPADTPAEHSVYHTFVIMAERRDALQRHLAERGIETKVHYPIPIHRQRVVVESGEAASCPVTEWQVERILSLPIYPELSREDLDSVVTSIREFYKG